VISKTNKKSEANDRGMQRAACNMQPPPAAAAAVECLKYLIQSREQHLYEDINWQIEKPVTTDDDESDQLRGS